MIMDERLEFADATALNTGVAGTYLIGDVIDLEVARDIGNGQPLYLVVTVATAPTSGTSAATAAFKLASDAQEAIATNGTATEHLASAAKGIAALSAGTVVLMASVPLEGNEYERYLGILQVTGGEAFTAGAINAFLTLDPHGWKAYADGNV